jgi:energy-coupling factor transporter transmembrane protein EcfT
MLTLLFIWLAVGVTLAVLSNRSSSGLSLAYFVGLSLIHVPGAIIHLDAEEWNRTRVGFEQTVIGAVAFVIAVIIVRFSFAATRQDRSASTRRSSDLTPYRTGALDRVALLYFALGGLTFFVVMPIASTIPSATAVLSSWGSLIIVGPCLLLWSAQRDGNWRKFWLTVVFLPVLPLFTLIQFGFIGYGIYWIMAIFSFLFAQSRGRLIYIGVAPMLIFVGLSVFVNYMAARNEIRNLVWHQRASLGARLQRVESVVTNFQWLDFDNNKQREVIDSRLNQNLLVGAAISRLGSGLHEYASGDTISRAIVGLIPRALWPDKPAVGGGGDVVTQYTGIRFAKGTSVGAGQVLEFYVNFGTWGVIGGFLLYGLLLGFIDLQISRYLHRNEHSRFVLFFVVGIALLQPGGNLVEILVAAAGAVVGVIGLNHFVQHRGATGAHTLPRDVSV